MCSASEFVIQCSLPDQTAPPRRRGPTLDAGGPSGCRQPRQGSSFNMPTNSSRPARTRGRRASRRLRIFVPLFVCALIAGMAGSIALARWGEGLIQRKGVEGLTANEQEETRIVNVLVVGDDSREGLTKEQI